MQGVFEPKKEFWMPIPIEKHSWKSAFGAEIDKTARKILIWPEKDMTKIGKMKIRHIED
jgi:hypothetical protein